MSGYVLYSKTKKLSYQQDLRKDTNCSVDIGKNYQKYTIL